MISMTVTRKTPTQREVVAPVQRGRRERQPEAVEVVEKGSRGNCKASTIQQDEEKGNRKRWKEDAVKDIKVNTNCIEFRS